MKAMVVAVALMAISALGISDEPNEVWDKNSHPENMPKAEVYKDLKIQEETKVTHIYPYEEFLYEEAKRDIEDMLNKLRERKL